MIIWKYLILESSDTMKKVLKWLIIIMCFYIFLVLNNEWLKVTSHEFTSEKIPQQFDGFKIVQLSDLHDAEFGENHERLIKKVEKLDPNIIVFTGDVIDSRRYDLEKSLSAMKQLVEIAPVYYVLGNHEVATNETAWIYEQLQSVGVSPLKNESIPLEMDGETIALAGIEDPLMGVPVETMIEKAFASTEDGQLQVLLSHRPERFDDYVAASLDLVLTGHAHGGQIRLPFIGGLVAPTQGLFPKYTGGVYQEENTEMIVNRGLGNSIFPQRLFNRPEIIEITFKSS